LTDGVVLVDKPAGVSSHDVVLVARRALGERQIGHAGTLDPFATGLLVLLVGRATRLLPYLDGEPKRYDATIRFGAETDTDDLLGVITRETAPPTVDAVATAIPALTGTIDQQPPVYSAKRVGGRRAYEAARAGESLELSNVAVRVHEWLIHGWRGADLDVTVVCAGGTYVRSLARDLGRLTGSAAHLVALRRTQSGAFSVSDAVSLDELRAGRQAVLPPLRALGGMPIETAAPADVARIVRGQEIPASVGAERAAIVNADGALVALAERRGDRWQPRVVMRRG